VTAAELQLALEQRGFALRPAGDRIIVRPFSDLTADDRAALDAHKSALLALLSAPLPYINEQGDLVIPFAAPARYHYWKEGGQSVIATLREIGASQPVIDQHAPPALASAYEYQH
jgi:hypothetical protein